MTEHREEVEEEEEEEEEREAQQQQQEEWRSQKQKKQKQKDRTPKNPCPHEARAKFLDSNLLCLAETVLDLTNRVTKLLERKCFTKGNSSCLWNCLGHQSECGDVKQHKRKN